MMLINPGESDGCDCCYELLSHISWLAPTAPSVYPRAPPVTVVWVKRTFRTVAFEETEDRDIIVATDCMLLLFYH